MARISGSADYLFQKIASGKPDKLSLDGEKKIQARKWFRTAAQSITQIDAVRFMNGAERDRWTSYLSKNNIGQMFMFWYDAKLKKQLPYWDRLPLIFVVDVGPGFFYGINMHYLPHSLRARMMDALYTIYTNKGYNANMKLQLSYAVLKSSTKFKYFKPCFKKYLVDHVNSRYMKISSDEWDMCLMLPTERFEKARKQRVWNESAAQVSKQNA